MMIDSTTPIFIQKKIYLSFIVNVLFKLLNQFVYVLQSKWATMTAVCMLSLCMCGFSPPAVQKHAREINWKLQIVGVNECDCECE